MTLPQQVKETDAQFIEAFNRRAALCTPMKRCSCHQDGPLAVGGSEAVVEGFRDLLDLGWKNKSVESVRIDLASDLAYHVDTRGADVPAIDEAEALPA